MIGKRVDANQEEIVAALRSVGCRVLSLAKLGNGAPDLLVCRMGGNVWHDRFYLLEVKKGNGKLRPAQVVFHSQWPVSVVRSIAEAFQVVGIPIATEVR